MQPDILRRRPLPSFDQWLAENGDGSRGDGFDAFVDLVERTLAKPAGELDADSASFLRMTKGIFVAAVETCNLEYSSGRSPEQIIQHLPRVLACVAMYAMASVLNNDASYRTVAKVLIEEFRFAAKEAADQMTEARDRAPPDAGGGR